MYSLDSGSEKGFHGSPEIKGDQRAHRGGRGSSGGIILSFLLLLEWFTIVVEQHRIRWEDDAHGSVQVSQQHSSYQSQRMSAKRKPVNVRHVECRSEPERAWLIAIEVELV